MDTHYKGYVEKSVGVFKNKSKIWMVLGGLSLTFYKDQKGDSCIGSIELTEITDVTSKDDNSFVVITSSKTYTFTPCTTANVVEWIRAIKKSVNRDTQSQQNSTKSLEIDTVLPETQSSIFGVKLKSTRLSRSSSDSDSRNSLQKGDAKRSNSDANSAHRDNPVQLELSKEEQDRKAKGKATEVSSTRRLSESVNADVYNTAEYSGTANTTEKSKQTEKTNMREFNTTSIEVETNIKPIAMSSTGNTSPNESMEEMNTSNSVINELPLNCCKNIMQQIRDNTGRSLCQTFEKIDDQTNKNSETFSMHENNIDGSSEWTCSTSSLTDQSQGAAEAQDGAVTTQNKNDTMEKMNCSPSVERETTFSKWQTEQSSSIQPSKSVSVVSAIKGRQFASDDTDISKVQMRRSSSGIQSGLNESNELTKVNENYPTEEFDISEVIMRKSSRTSKSKSYRFEQAKEASGNQEHISDTTSIEGSYAPNTSADDEESKPEEETNQDEVFLADDVFANMSDKEESAVQMPVSRSTRLYSEAFEKLKVYLLEHQNGFEHDVDCHGDGAVDRLRQYFKVRQ